MLGLTQRSRLGVHFSVLTTGVGVLKDIEALGISRHDAVLDSVVDHLDEMASAAGPAMQVALLGGALARATSGRGLQAAGAWRQRLEDRAEPADRLGFAADHQAVAALEAPDAAARAGVYVVQPAGRELLGAANVVDVVRVAAVNDRVADGQQRRQFGQGF